MVTSSGKNGVHKLYAFTGQRMGEARTAELDRFFRCVAGERKKPRRLERRRRNMAVYAIRQQVQRCLWQSFLKRFRLINEVFRGATTRVPADLGVLTTH